MSHATIIIWKDIVDPNPPVVVDPKPPVAAGVVDPKLPVAEPKPPVAGVVVDPNPPMPDVVEPNPPVETPNVLVVAAFN